MTVEIGGDTTGLDKALKSVNSTIKTIQTLIYFSFLIRYSNVYTGTNRLWFVSAAHMSIERFFAHNAQKRSGCECVEHCGRAKARSNACFNHICL